MAYYQMIYQRKNDVVIDALLVCNAGDVTHGVNLAKLPSRAVVTRTEKKYQVCLKLYAWNY